MSAITALIRFSFVQDVDTGFTVTRKTTLEERKAILFASRRMDARFTLFEAICLPSLIAQDARLFTAVLLVSDAMPAPYRDRLERLVAPYPNLRLFPVPPMATGAAMRAAAASVARDGEMKITLRLDDDDALSADFAARIDRYRQPRYDGHCLTLLKGVGLCRLYGRLRAWDRDKPFVSAGLGFINRAEAPETIYDCGNHNLVAERFPTLIDTSFTAYLQSTHRSNDSSGHIPLTAYLRPSDTMSLAAARDRYGAAFPLLNESDFRFI